MSAAPKHVSPQWPSSIPCRIAFIGEAPSDEEITKGVPLVGPSGRVFNQLLRTAGIERSEHLVTNVFDQQIPDNNIKNWCASTKEAQGWTDYGLPPVQKGAWLRPEYAPHLARLAEELERAQATVVVPMGATALWALTGTGAISACRGAIMEATRLVPGRKLVPSFHPAHVIHDFRLFHVTAADFEKALRESEYPEVRLPKRELWLAPTIGDLLHFKRKWLDTADVISCDIETGWKQITCIGFAPDRHRAIVVPFWDLRKPSRSYWPTVAAEVEAWEVVRDVLEGPVPKLFQNGPYDIFWLWDHEGIRVNNYRHDTRLMHHALYPELPKSLEFMGATYATQGAWKLMRPGRAEKRDE